MYALLKTAGVVALFYAFARMPRMRVRDSMRYSLFNLGRLINRASMDAPRWARVYREVTINQVENIADAIDEGFIDGLCVDNPVPSHPAPLLLPISEEVILVSRVTATAKKRACWQRICLYPPWTPRPSASPRPPP